jgi:hypothetical protein
MDTAASVVTANDDVLHLEDIDGELHDREAVEVGVDDDVRHVPVHEKLTRGESHKFLGGNTAVGTADPEIFRLLLDGEILEKFRVFCAEVFSPCLVVGEEFAD